MKRFYEIVDYKKVAGSYAITLDDKPVQTPLGVNLVAKTDTLARKVVEEWQAQKDTIDPDAMPLTQLLNTQIDKVAQDRASVIEAVLAFSESELVCYYADAPDDLIARQKRLWGKVTDWILAEYGIDMVITYGLSAAIQSEETCAGLRNILENLDDSDLTALQMAVSVTGSLLISIALIKGGLTPQEAFEAACLEEIYQAEKWGIDKEAAARRKNIQNDLENVWVFCNASRIS